MPTTPRHRAEKPVTLTLVPDAAHDDATAADAPTATQEGAETASDAMAGQMEPPTTPVVEPVVEQFNKHDAKMWASEIDRMLLAMRSMGYGVDMGQLKAAADAQAACEILVALGLASEAEVQVRSYRAARGLVAAALQQAEEAALKAQQQARAVQPVRPGPLVVARH